MKVVALAGGVGAGKFLRGLVRAVRPEDLTVVVNTGDDIEIHGLHVSPDLDSVMYWLAGVMDRSRGWGRAGETFRTTEELGRLSAEGSWFGLGDLDLATHLLRTAWLREGVGLAAVSAELARRFGVTSTLLPMTEDPAPTTIQILDALGGVEEVHFQDYWVKRRGADEVKGVRYGGEAATPAPGVLGAITTANAIVLPPSNPVASIGPILAVPGILDAVRARRDRVVGVSGIVGGAPLAGMADRLLPAIGVEVSAAGVAEHYRDLLAAWVIDRADQALAPRIEALGIGVGVTDTIMANDLRAEALARYALSLL